MWWYGIHYEKLELLGEGSQGQVFKALRRDRKSNLSQIVALKVLHSKNSVDLWRREFASLRQVRSLHCVQVLAFDRVAGRPALVMEYVDGASLLQLAQSAPFSDAEVSEVVAQIEAGLKDLASCGLCHGDLSPANILIDHQGVVKLLDFGLANFDGPETRLTPDFAAPERLYGAKPDFLSDLYSLGRVAAYLRGGQAPTDETNSYVAPSPDHRKPQNLRSRPEVRTCLAERILAHKTQIQWSRNCKTRSANFNTLGSEKNSRLASVAAMVCLCLCLVLSSSTALSTMMPASWATLTVRTNKWHHIEINGQKVGYAPFTIAVPAGRPLTISWSRADGGGRKALRAEAGERMFMSDRDFTP